MKKFLKMFLHLLPVLLLLSLVLLVTIPFIPIPINRELKVAEIIYTDHEHFKIRTVTINGWYNVNFFRGNHRFRGLITISDLEQTKVRKSFCF